MAECPSAYAWAAWVGRPVWFRVSIRVCQAALERGSAWMEAWAAKRAPDRSWRVSRTRVARTKRSASMLVRGSTVSSSGDGGGLRAVVSVAGWVGVDGAARMADGGMAGEGMADWLTADWGRGGDAWGGGVIVGAERRWGYQGGGL